MSNINSIIDEIKNKIWTSEVPKYITKHVEYDENIFAEMIYDRTSQHLVLNYIITVMQRDDVSKEQFNALLEMAKTREGVQDIASGIILNSEFDPDLIMHYRHAKRVHNS